MKIKLFLIAGVGLLTIAITSCKKQNAAIEDMNNTTKVIKLENVKFADATSSYADPGGGGANYDEQACTVKADTVWMAGTKCFESVGYSCKKTTGCVPVSFSAASGEFTKEEIQRKIELVEKAYGIKYTY